MRNKLVLKLDKDQIEVLSSALRLYLNWNLGEDKKNLAQEILRAMERHLEAGEIREEKADERAKSERGRAEIVKEKCGIEYPHRLGRGERVEFWAGFVKRKGETNIMLCGVNPRNGYVVGKFLFPSNLAPELLRFLIQAACNNI